MQNCGISNVLVRGMPQSCAKPLISFAKDYPPHIYPGVCDIDFRSTQNTYNLRGHIHIIGLTFTTLRNTACLMMRVALHIRIWFPQSHACSFHGNSSTQANCTRCDLAQFNWRINTNFKTLRPRQNGRHFADDILNSIWIPSWMKMFEFLSKFHWSLLIRVQLTIFNHWFR